MNLAFATVAFLLFDIDVFHFDRGPEFDNMASTRCSACVG